MTTQKMLSLLRKGITEYKMIKDGDRIAVGVSGGKDSVTLLKLLIEYKKFSPEKFDLIAISVDLNFEGERSDYTKIKELCDKDNIPFYVENTEIAEIVFKVRKEQSPCALCSKMRKGALYSACKKYNCNKVALGHHSDDLIETMFLSMFYEGRLSTFAPKSYLDKTDLTLIRPMIFLSESDIETYSVNLPIIASRCPVNEKTKREEVKDYIKEIKKKIPNVKEMIFTALIHPERYNLFDKFEKEKDLF